MSTQSVCHVDSDASHNSLNYLDNSSPPDAHSMTAPLRVDAAVRDARKNAFEIAAAKGPVEVHGVTAEGALAAPGEITFGDFIRLPQTLEMFGSPADSDAAKLLLEFQEAFQGPATRKMLIDFVRRQHTGKPRGFRYWNHLGASIWNLYVGLRAGKNRTGKAHNAEVDRFTKAAKRAGKERQRSTLRRKPKSRADAQKIQATKLQRKIDWRLDRLAKKLAEMQKLSSDVNALESEVTELESELRVLL
jgi:polyhydroxyalkanoate synthesis regulator phasin